MGQKTNPIGLRLAVNKDWNSKWFAEKKEFGKLLAEDRKIRKAVVKVKFADFTRTTKECVSTHPDLATYQALLAEAHTRKHQPIRLLGAGVRFAEEDEEISRDPQQELAFHG